MDREVEHPARQEFQFAKAQLLIYMNAKSFDEVANTNLTSAIGKLIVFTQGTHHDSGLPGRERQASPVELHGDRYGKVIPSDPLHCEGFQPDGSAEPDGGREWLNNDGGFGVEDVDAYTNWHPPINGSFQEPNNFMDRPENALQFYSYDAVATPTPSSFWNDEVGSSSMSGGYVVESLVPKPMSILLSVLGTTLISVSRRRRDA